MEDMSNYSCFNFDADSIVIKAPKEVARIRLCGGGLTFTIFDNMQFEMPTEEQRENLKKFFGIEVELIDEL